MKSPEIAYINGLVVGTAVGLMLGSSCTAKAEARIYKLDLSYEKILHNSDPMVPELRHKDWGDAVALSSGVEIGRFYLDSRFHFESALAKAYTVGLQFSTGFRIFDWLDLDYTHHSRHSADVQNSYAERPEQLTSGYPLWDSVGVVIHFIPGQRR